CIADQSAERHSRKAFRLEKPIALCIVRFSGQDHARKTRDQTRIHLPIAVDLDNDGCAIFHGLRHSSHRCAADTKIGVVMDDCDTGIANIVRDEFSGLLRTGVIDDVNSSHLWADALQNTENMIAYPKARDYDRQQW